MRLRPLAAVAGLSLLALTLWAFWLEPSSLRTQTYDLPLLQWPAAQTGLRIAVLADIHAGAPYIDAAKLAEICRLVDQAKPDIVVNTGDYIMGDMPFGRRMPPEEIAERLACLHAPLGSYAVLGNNDNMYGAERVRKALEAHRTVVLDNRILRIEQGRYRFWLMGIPDASNGAPFQPHPADQIQDGTPIIALTHQAFPFIFTPPWVNLMIVGHTHGGQVRLPFVGRPALRYLGIARYAAGHYAEQTDLFVSTGIGTNDLPVRLGVPPEISLLVLRPAP